MSGQNNRPPRPALHNVDNNRRRRLDAQRTSTHVNARTPEPTRMFCKSMILRFASAGRSYVDLCTTKLAVPVATCCVPILLHDTRRRSHGNAHDIVSGEHMSTRSFSLRRRGAWVEIVGEVKPASLRTARL